jgi:hypothetical protein
MKFFSYRLACIIWLISIPVYAQINPFYTPSVPSYMMSITDPDSIESYLHSKNMDLRIGALIRLGDIGNDRALAYLINSFEKEPFRTGDDQANGVKYYSLLNIGRVGNLEASRYLINLIMTNSKQIGRQSPSYLRQHSLGDTLESIKGAIDGLAETGTNMAELFLDSVFTNVENCWAVRAWANYALLTIGLKSKSIITSEDTAKFLIGKLNSTAWVSKRMNESNEVNINFEVVSNIDRLLFKYRSFTAPYLDSYIKSLPPNSERLQRLNQLKADMDLNPPQTQD